MPSLVHPWILLLVLPLGGLLVRWYRRPLPAVRFSGLSDLPVFPTRRVRWARRGGLALRAVGLLLLLLALARPRWPDPGSRIPTEGLALVLVVDVSRSMDNKDFFWKGEVVRRLDGVKGVFREFVNGRPNDLIALVTFATRPETACPLTLDHLGLARILEQVEPKSLLTEATTNPGDAIAWALHVLHKAPTKRKVLVFLTDGESNVPPPALTPRQAGQLAANLNVPIYALDAAFEDDPAGDADKARQTLEDLAGMTKGRYFKANDGAGLSTAMTEIDRLERSAIESFQYRRYREGFVWFGLAALACWLTVLGLEATRWRRLP